MYLLSLRLCFAWSVDFVFLSLSALLFTPLAYSLGILPQAHIGPRLSLNPAPMHLQCIHITISVEHTYPTLASCQLHGLASRTRGANTSSSAVPVLLGSSVWPRSYVRGQKKPGYEATHGRKWRPYQRVFKPRMPANG